MGGVVNGCLQHKIACKHFDMLQRRGVLLAREKSRFLAALQDSNRNVALVRLMLGNARIR